MRVTIVVDDNKVLVEGQPETVDCSALIAPGIHAVQWYSTFGEIEYSTDLPTGDRRPNQKIIDISQFQPLIDAWTVEAQKP
jgi:hypothetical protein